MRLRGFLTALVLAGFVTACRQSATGPSPAPAPSAPTISGLVIVGEEIALTDSSTTYAATATLSDGTMRTVTPTWTSSNQDVASVDSAGRLDARIHGATTLTAAHEGRTATKTVQVVNNYEGRWTGRFVVTFCDHSGVYADIDGGGWCRGRIGSTGSIELTLSQTGIHRSEVNGALYGDIEVTGVVTADGRLNLGGTAPLLSFDGDEVLGQVQVGAWNTNLARPGTMTGRWAQNFASSHGNAYEEYELVTMTRAESDSRPNHR